MGGVSHLCAVLSLVAPLRSRAPPSKVQCRMEQKVQVQEEPVPPAPEFGEWFSNTPLAISKSLARATYRKKGQPPTELPGYWDTIWKLPFMQGGAPGSPLTFGDTALTFKYNIEQLFGGYPSRDGAPLAAADISDIDLKALFLGMKNYFDRYGPVFKMCFGPKSFMVISDPVVARHLLRERSRGYDKGQLAVVLEDIMGKGLIPADPETWARRRRAIAPGFHSLYLQRMVDEFGQANEVLIKQLHAAAVNDQQIDMEERFGSVALDIIGKAVFNYDFDSVSEESPVVKAAVRALGEVEHRALVPLPYWKVPGANSVVPRLRDFERDMGILNDKLYELIEQCLETRDEADLEALQNKDYANVRDPSLLRFLVDLRGEEVDNKQMRDDLITLLIAGHETTASVLTWTVFALSQDRAELEKVQAEIDEVVGDGVPTIEQMKHMRHLQNALAESLRMWPAPPLLLRRALDDDTWPEGGTGVDGGVKIPRAGDVMISMYNMGRSPMLWEHPDTYDPSRWDRPYINSEVKGWAGYDPSLRRGLYPSEAATDFAFIPFGGGERKCVGDQFAMLEAMVTASMLLRRFEFVLDMPADEVGMTAAATIHTRNGLLCKVRRRA